MEYVLAFLCAMFSKTAGQTHLFFVCKCCL